MARYRLGKAQIKRLLDGKPVVDGHGRKYLADKKVKEILREMDNYNLCDKLEVFMEDGGIDIVRKGE